LHDPYFDFNDETDLSPLEFVMSNQPAVDIRFENDAIERISILIVAEKETEEIGPDRLSFGSACSLLLPDLIFESLLAR